MLSFRTTMARWLRNQSRSHNNMNEHKREKKFLIISIIATISVLILLCAVLFFVARSANRTHPNSLSNFLSAERQRGPLPLAQANLVRQWMTFDYINKLFDLPENYLKTTFSISDSRYPVLSLSEYRESISTTSPTFIENVQKAIMTYSTSTDR